ncbi:MAG: hypothetical protein ABFD97_07325 [Syntrophobacter sp.]
MSNRLKMQAISEDEIDREVGASSGGSVATAGGKEFGTGLEPVTESVILS